VVDKRERAFSPRQDSIAAASSPSGSSPHAKFSVLWQKLPSVAILVKEMQTMNISLPEPLKEFVDRQVGSGRYSSVSEYVRDLIRDDQKRKAQEALEAVLLEGIHSSEPTAMTRQDWEEIRREAWKQFQARKSQKRA
jgi:antitoxin ParD1/3/4